MKEEKERRIIYDRKTLVTKIERLKKQKFLNCHICNSSNIEKTLMSPSVLVSKIDSKAEEQRKKYKEWNH